MARFAVLLRGVNVGSAKRVPMAEFRALLEALGHGSVRTLLNSGNAVFDSGERSAARHAQRIHESLLERLKVDVPVVVKSAQDFSAITAGNVLAPIASDPSRLLVAFAQEAAALAALAPVAALAAAPEMMHIGPRAAYLWCPNGILQSQAGEALLGRVGRVVTTRNWGTVCKLEGLLRAGA